MTLDRMSYREQLDLELAALEHRRRQLVQEIIEASVEADLGAARSSAAQFRV
ncbi:MAG: hypothetical protein KIS73_07970 [Enhydrobacter sp.]|nr:hypothetical protein [Enhydrobacter sp.]